MSKRMIKMSPSAIIYHTDLRITEIKLRITEITLLVSTDLAWFG